MSERPATRLRIAWMLALVLAADTRWLPPNEEPVRRLHAMVAAQQARTLARSAVPACVVAKLADGDSFTCADGRKIRLLLIDAPELRQSPWGLMAKRQLERVMGPGTSVRLELDTNPTDRYGRTLAYAWVDTLMINDWMIANGWAVVLAYENVRHLPRLQRSERTAQALKRGFWRSWAFRCRPVNFRAHRCGSRPARTRRKSTPTSP